MSNFSSRLRERRKLKNLTQQQFASEIGISCRTVQQYESGDRTPTFEGLVAIAKFFDVSLDYLCGIDPPLAKSSPGTSQPYTQRVDPGTGDILFEYEKNGEKAVLRFPRNATVMEIHDKIVHFLPLLRGLGLTDEPPKQ